MRESVRKYHLINELVLGDFNRINERLAHEVMKEWDFTQGELTKEWFEFLLQHKWEWLSMQN